MGDERSNYNKLGRRQPEDFTTEEVEEFKENGPDYFKKPLITDGEVRESMSIVEIMLNDPKLQALLAAISHGSN